MKPNRLCEGDEQGQGLETARLPGHASLPRGQTLAIVALLLVVLVAFLALVIDVGHAYSQRRFLQNAADAGALAGARALALHQGTAAAEAAAGEYAGLNGAQGCIPTVLDRNIRVVVTRNVDTFFASVIGIRSIPVSAQAVAGYTSTRTVSGSLLLPLVITRGVWLDAMVNPGHTITIWESVPDYPGGPWDLFLGGRGWLNMSVQGAGANDLKKIVCDLSGEYPRQLTEGEWINGDDGLKNSALQEFEICRENTVVLFPLFDEWCKLGDTRCTNLGFLPKTGTGQHMFHISGFVAFHIERVDWTGNPKCIVGHLEEGYVLPDQPGGDTEGGVSTVRLIR